jgi:hypothetical protein
MLRLIIGGGCDKMSVSPLSPRCPRNARAHFSEFGIFPHTFGAQENSARKRPTWALLGDVHAAACGLKMKGLHSPFMHPRGGNEVYL